MKGRYNRGRMSDLFVVIVSYNVRDLLRDCLHSVQKSRGIELRTCVVDNCSTDGSVEMVRNEFPDVELIASTVNGGFPYGNNLAMREVFPQFEGALRPVPPGSVVKTGGRIAQPAGIPLVSTGKVEAPAKPRYVVLLNPDTVVPEDGLANMVAYLDERPHVGAAGPKLVRQDGSLDLACRRSFPTPEVSFYRKSGLSRLFPNNPRFARYNLTDRDPNEEMEVDSVCGAFMMVRTEAIEKVGLLDETFFMYGEDLDWAYRLKLAGWQVRYNPAVTVLHYKGQSSRQRSVRALNDFYRAMLIFYDKHFAYGRPAPLNWIIQGGIYLFWGIAASMNMLRPAAARRVS